MNFPMMKKKLNQDTKLVVPVGVFVGVFVVETVEDEVVEHVLVADWEVVVDSVFVVEGVDDFETELVGDIVEVSDAVSEAVFRSCWRSCCW